MNRKKQRIIETLLLDVAVHNMKNLNEQDSRADRIESPLNIEDFATIKESVLIKSSREMKVAKRRNFSRAVIILICVLLVSGTLVSNVSAVKKELHMLLQHIEKQYTHMKASEIDTEVPSAVSELQEWIPSLEGIYFPSYLPEDCILDKDRCTNNNGILTVVMDKHDGQLIYISYPVEYSYVNLDTQNAEIQDVHVGDDPGVLISKGGYVTLTWTHNDLWFQISGLLKEGEAIKIAESLIYIP